MSVLFDELMNSLEEIQEQVSHSHNGDSTSTEDYYSCHDTCSGSCSGDCEDSCAGTCDSGCRGSCEESCSGSCENISYL